MIKLSILIPSLTSRNESLGELLYTLNNQQTDEVEVLLEIDNGEASIGAKRNKLLQRAKGEYISFIDDDDMISRHYIKEALEGIRWGVDCISLRGVITFDGKNPEIFEHSIQYKEYKTNTTGLIKYERYPNHLNVIKSSIAKQFTFPEINHGEDTDFATQIYKSGLIKTEHFIDEVLYHYQYKNK